MLDFIFRLNFCIVFIANVLFEFFLLWWIVCADVSPQLVHFVADPGHASLRVIVSSFLDPDQHLIYLGEHALDQASFLPHALLHS